MPAKARKAIIDPTMPGVYHCMSRCVRRAFLCGYDRENDKDYGYRRDWIEDRMRHLAGLFAVELHFFCVMQNHLHLLLRNRPDLVDRWSDEAVMRRACRAFPRKFEKRGVQGGQPSDEQLAHFLDDAELVAEMRLRLSDISWFMRQLTQCIARRANQEDECPGHFWEQRFRSLPVTEVIGLVVVAIYIDLNQIAAGEAETPETSRYTSAYHRIQGLQARRQGNAAAEQHDGFLPPIDCRGDGRGYSPAGGLSSPRVSDDGLFEITLEKYLELLDWTQGRRDSDRVDEPGVKLAPILQRIGVTSTGLIHAVSQYAERWGTNACRLSPQADRSLANVE